MRPATAVARSHKFVGPDGSLRSAWSIQPAAIDPLVKGASTALIAPILDNHFRTFAG